MEPIKRSVFVTNFVQTDMDIGKIYTDIFVTELHIQRESNEYLVSFTLTDGEQRLTVQLIGIRDIDSLTEIFQAERLWIEKDSTSQLEFGAYILGISHEYYTEIRFDELA